MRALIFPRPEALEARIAPAIAHPFPVTALDGDNGFRLSGADVRDYAGFAVAGAGDVNGDGFDDLIVGAPFGDNGGGLFDNGGTAYVVFGKATGLPANLALSALDGTNGFRITSQAAGDLFGRSVAGAGDLNGDGFDDIVVGAPSALSGTQNGGVAYVIFGKSTPFGASIAVSSLDGMNGFRVSSSVDENNLGTSVARGGDVNGDGIDDLLVGSPRAKGGGSYGGSVFVVFGKTAAFSENLAVSALNGTNGFRIDGEASGDEAGSALSMAGDVNGDGIDDILIGAYSTETGGKSAGSVYVVYGKDTATAGGFASPVSLAALNGGDGFELTGSGDYSNVGWSVGGGGDVDGDGFDDIVIGTRDGEVAHVVFGKAGNFSASTSLSSLGAAERFEITGLAGASDGLGSAVAIAGDIDDDGVDDILIGAPFGNHPGTDSGAAYVIYGDEERPSGNFPVASLNGINGFRVNGVAEFDTAGRSVAAAGDVNGDGIADLILGAPEADSTANGDDEGGAFVIFGGAGGGGGPEVELLKKGKVARFVDVDGDVVLVKTNKGPFVVGDFLLAASGVGAQLQLIGIAGDTAFTGAKITISAKPGPLGGDGAVNVGAINAAGVDIGKVKVPGDLGRIEAGDPATPKAALKGLNIRSLGALGFATQNPLDQSLDSEIQGKTGAVTIKGDVVGAIFEVRGGGIKSVKIAGDIVGGAGQFSGMVFADGIIKKAKIAGSLIGGDGLESGVLEAFGGFGTVTIVGSLVGGSGFQSGTLVTLGPVKGIKVGGDLMGGSGEGSGSIVAVGAGDTAGIRKIGIAGSVIAGSHPLTGILGTSTLGKIKIGQDLRGTAAASAKILAEGLDIPADAKAALAIKGLTVGGKVEFAEVLAGYNTDGQPSNPDVQIGKVKVGTTWMASSLIAGIDRDAGGFGDGDDIVIGTGGQAGIVSRIASVLIKGAATGTTATGDHFAITAQELGKVSIAKRKAALTLGADNLLLDAANGDFRAREV